MKKFQRKPIKLNYYCETKKFFMDEQDFSILTVISNLKRQQELFNSAIFRTNKKLYENA